MYSKTEVMDETCSSTFPRKLKQNFNIFGPKIRAKSQNQMAVKTRYFFFFFKAFLKAWPHNLNLRSHFGEFAFWLTEFIEVATFE